MLLVASMGYFVQRRCLVACLKLCLRCHGDVAELVLRVLHVCPVWLVVRGIFFVCGVFYRSTTVPSALYCF